VGVGDWGNKGQQLTANRQQPCFDPRCFRSEGLAALGKGAENGATEGSEIGDPTSGGWFDKGGSRDDGRAKRVQIEFFAVEGPQDALRRDDNFNGLISGVKESQSKDNCSDHRSPVTDHSYLPWSPQNITAGAINQQRFKSGLHFPQLLRDAASQGVTRTKILGRHTA
jgi:hypothetical protein